MNDNCALKIEPLGAALGAKVHAVNLREPLSTDVVTQIKKALDKYQVLAFEGQHDLSAEQHVRIASLFGFPHGSEPWRSLSLIDGTHYDAALIQDIPANRWHTDMSFTPRPTVAGTLCAIEIPEVGGDTGFVSTAAIYDNLSEPLQALCAELEGIHTMWPHGGDAWVADETRDYIERCKRLLPPIRHPLVQTHPNSGRKFLFIGGEWMTEIVHPEIPNWKMAECKMLHDFLNSQLLNVEYQFRWSWKPGDFIVWDERCTNHLAIHPLGGSRRIVRSVWAWPDNEPSRMG